MRQTQYYLLRYEVLTGYGGTEENILSPKVAGDRSDYKELALRQSCCLQLSAYGMVGIS